MSNIVKFSLVAVLSLGLMPNSTFAQDAADEDVDEVIVTGSKIKTSVFDSSKPLQIISDAAIERTGLNKIGDIPQTISSNDDKTSGEPSIEIATSCSKCAEGRLSLVWIVHPSSS